MTFGVCVAYLGHVPSQASVGVREAFLPLSGRDHGALDQPVTSRRVRYRVGSAAYRIAPDERPSGSMTLCTPGELRAGSLGAQHKRLLHGPYGKYASPI